MNKDKIDLLVKDFKKKLEEINCHYSALIFIKSDKPNENEIMIFRNEPKEIMLPMVRGSRAGQKKGGDKNGGRS